MNRHADQETIDSWNKYLKKLQFKRKKNCGTLPPEFYPNYDETLLSNKRHSRGDTSVKKNEDTTGKVLSEQVPPDNVEPKGSKRYKTNSSSCLTSNEEKVKIHKQRLYYHTNEINKIKQMLKELDDDNNNTVYV